ncbi:23S rRNA (uracil(1939)-C(5))-methyltransferase RlmD [Patulibacter sp.]|uniref:23S rRNA (uracil(1939)-C(5))-methyltransferase RlmD n=1 Tax=Patulibacter sp. TaxID=1912859 RepID=UPI002715A707|nr:23S rRNA (uracil(1939)-C(5))-methyltransferase RlmD [Patulibacter sp.]MDO9407586.1 23S rRNA (uracil(1939)-C(5))-methyltransferase RlmD [Patulibacter sp.]
MPDETPRHDPAAADAPSESPAPDEAGPAGPTSSPETGTVDEAAVATVEGDAGVDDASGAPDDVADATAAGAPAVDPREEMRENGGVTKPKRQRPPRPHRGEQLELKVETLAHGGNGIARTEGGWVVFVRGGIPGDVVRGTITKRKKDYGEAVIDELLVPSEERIPAVADHPGAPWQVLPYERQLEIKAGQVEDALRRLGGHTDVEIEPIVPSVEQWRYRNKLEYSFGEDGEGNLKLGFHAAGSWQDIVHIDDCLLASEIGNEARNLVHAWCVEQGLSAYDRKLHQGLLRNLVVREGTRTGELQVRIVTSVGEFDVAGLATHLNEAMSVAPTGVLWTQMTQVGETTYGGDTDVVTGGAYIHEEIRGLRLRISPEGFFQTNTVMAERLYELAAEYAGLEGWERVFDLYCGSGSLGLTLASHAGEIIGVEIVEESIQDAATNAALNDIRNAKFLASDARTGLPDAIELAGRPDVLIVDPPRAGLGPRVCRRIVEAAPKRIVYVSCNPTTLAPDAQRIVEGGYVLRKVRPVDMFPQTPHVECVAVLDRVA